MIARARRRVRRLEWILGLAIVTIAIAVLWPAVRVGLLADDLFQLAYADGLYGPKSPLGLYFFAFEDPAATAVHAARGSLPWWTVPEFRFAHLRPLASLSLTRLIFTPAKIEQGIDVVRGMQSLEAIDVQFEDATKVLRPAQFWAKYDAGDFKAPAESPAP